jgi:ferredoxin
MNVSIDPKRCSGHGRCYVVSPTVFVDDDAGYGQVRTDVELEQDLLADARRGAEACPEQAITVTP